VINGIVQWIGVIGGAVIMALLGWVKWLGHRNKKLKAVVKIQEVQHDIDTVAMEQTTTINETVKPVIAEGEKQEQKIEEATNDAETIEAINDTIAGFKPR